MSWVVPILATVFSSPVGLVPRELMNPATPIVARGFLSIRSNCVFRTAG
jgi:hypothetical protein